MIDIYNLVLEMRNYRCRMVQTEDQYIYIHDCIRQALLQGMSARWKPEEQKPEGGEPIYENAALVEPEQIYENTATGSDVDAGEIELKGMDDDDKRGSGEGVRNTEL